MLGEEHPGGGFDDVLHDDRPVGVVLGEAHHVPYGRPRPHRSTVFGSNLVLVTTGKLHDVPDCEDPFWLDPADCEDAVDVIVTDEEFAEFDVLVIEA